MSFHDTDCTAAAAVEPAGEVASLEQMENLSGLVADMMNTAIARTPDQLEQIARERLGPKATAEDARNLLRSVRATLNS